jgi:hypothetical protein
MNLRTRLERLERTGQISMNVHEMTDEQLARLAGFPPGYVPTDEELQAIIDDKSNGESHEQHR